MCKVGERQSLAPRNTTPDYQLVDRCLILFTETVPWNKCSNVYLHLFFLRLNNNSALH